VPPLKACLVKVPLEVKHADKLSACVLNSQNNINERERIKFDFYLLHLIQYRDQSYTLYIGMLVGPIHHEL
jgi:hypothetical protein